MFSNEILFRKISRKEFSLFREINDPFLEISCLTKQLFHENETKQNKKRNETKWYSVMKLSKKIRQNNILFAQLCMCCLSTFMSLPTCMISA
jgi:hypothetical protein